MLSPENRRFTVATVLLIASLFVIAVGAQAYVAQRAGEARDHKDRVYANCLTEFAADLVESLETRTAATAALNRARDRKDALLDRLIVLSNEAQASGAETQAELPPELVAEYEKVLKARVRAQERFARLSKEYESARKQNPYVSPKVVCQR